MWPWVSLPTSWMAPAILTSTWGLRGALKIPPSWTHCSIFLGAFCTDYGWFLFEKKSGGFPKVPFLDHRIYSQYMTAKKTPSKLRRESWAIFSSTFLRFSSMFDSKMMGIQPTFLFLRVLDRNFCSESFQMDRSFFMAHGFRSKMVKVSWKNVTHSRCSEKKHGLVILSPKTMAGFRRFAC